MPTASRRQQRIEAVLERLSAIRIEDGYSCDAGLKVFYAEQPALGPDDPESVICVVPQDTQIQANRMEILPLEIQVIVKPDLDDPYLAAEAVLGDVAQAMELADRSLGGLVKWMEIGQARLLPRPDGSTVTGMVQTYELHYLREWGTP